MHWRTTKRTLWVELLRPAGWYVCTRTYLPICLPAYLPAYLPICCITSPHLASHRLKETIVLSRPRNTFVMLALCRWQPAVSSLSNP